MLSANDDSNSRTCDQCHLRKLTCIVLVGNQACKFCHQQRKLCVVDGAPLNRQREQVAGQKRKAEEQEPVPRKRKRVPEMRDFIMSDKEVSADEGSERSVEEDPAERRLRRMEGLLVCLVEVIWMERKERRKERREARRKQEGRGE
jgi:hypothetical protein